MDPEFVRNNGLLEQYLLGLTSREENIAVEEYLAQHPEARHELEHLRSQLGVYLDETGFMEPDNPGENRLATQKYREQRDFLRVKNHWLKLTRGALAILSVCLLVTSIYFYRQNNQHSLALSAEKARHVQDDHLHAREIKHLTAEAVHWDSLHTVVAASEHGNLQLHYLLSGKTVLLDFSHLQGPAAGFAYHVHHLTAHGEESLFVIDAGKVNALYPLHDPEAKLKILYGPTVAIPAGPQPKTDLVAELSLAGFIGQR